MFKEHIRKASDRSSFDEDTFVFFVKIRKGCPNFGTAPHDYKRIFKLKGPFTHSMGYIHSLGLPFEIALLGYSQRIAVMDPLFNAH